MRTVLTIVHLTLHETARRRILLAALILGVAFLLLFATGVYFITHDVNRQANNGTLIERRMILTFITLAGLYAVNFLMVMISVLLPVDTLSGEITSGVMQTLASKPVRRSDILLGKWLAHLVLVAGYLVLMAGGVLLVARVIAHVTPPHLFVGLPLMLLEGVVFVTLSIAGGTRLSTVTNGVMVFGLFGLAFIGGWVEQISMFAGNESGRYVGTVASLIMPTEAMWQLAAHHMQPSVMRDIGATPLSPLSVPSPAMVWWAVVYVVAVLALAVRSFGRRPL